jgi:hypothetical protein
MYNATEVNICLKLLFHCGKNVFMNIAEKVKSLNIFQNCHIFIFK